MKEKARDLIYLDTNRYISLTALRGFYWGCFIVPFLMVVIGIVSINAGGVNWKTLFSLVSIAVWSLFYWIFVLTIQSKRTKKTFELRFLVNGISGMFISSLFWCLFASANLVADNPFVGFDFCLWVLFFYLLFSFFYMGLIVVGVHKGVYKKTHKKTHRSKAFIALFAAMLPLSGLFGRHFAKLVRAHASVSVQNIFFTFCFVLIFFLPALAHINFVQYYYCKKYGITCDEHGNTTSPMLERQCEKGKHEKKLPLIVKILIGIVCIPILFFVIIFILALIKVAIKNIFH